MEEPLDFREGAPGPEVLTLIPDLLKGSRMAKEGSQDNTEEGGPFNERKDKEMNAEAIFF